MYKTCEKQQESYQALQTLPFVLSGECSVITKLSHCSNDKMDLRYSITCVERLAHVFKAALDVLQSGRSKRAVPGRVKRFEFLDPEDGGDTSDCDAGYQEISNGCVECAKGYHEVKGVCTQCPYDTYSESAGSVSCVNCLEELKTVYDTSTSKSECTTVCILPSVSPNKLDVDNVYASKGERVKVDTVIGFECSNGLYYRGETYTKFICDESLSLPQKCYDVKVTNGEVYSIEGKQVALTCQVTYNGTKYDNAYVSWFRDGTDVNFQEGSNVMPVSESGTYSCAVDIDGYSMMSTANSSVTFLALSTGQKSTTVINKGDALALSCYANFTSSLPHFYFTWYNESGAVLSGGVQTSQNTSHITSTLLTSTQGVFICEVTYRDLQGSELPDKLTAQTNVYVRKFVIEPAAAFSGNKINMVRAGSDIILTCAMYGDDARIELAWFRNNVSIQSGQQQNQYQNNQPSIQDGEGQGQDNSTVTTLYKDRVTTTVLTIENTDEADSGVYKCGYNNMSSSVELIVTDLTVTLDAAPAGNYLVGESVTLTCRVDKPGTVRWMRDEVVIQDSARHSLWSGDIYGRIEEGETTSNYLSIKPLTKVDTGLYYCNGFYIDYFTSIRSKTSIQLIISSLDLAMSDRQAVTGSSVTMLCVVKGAPEMPTVSWSHSGARTEENWFEDVMTAELIMDDVSEDLNITCSASVRGFDLAIVGQLEIIDLVIDPGRVIRSFLDKDVLFTCRYNESLSSKFDGTFVWEKDGAECSDCVMISETPEKSVMKLQAKENSVLRCKLRKDVGGMMRSEYSTLTAVLNEGSLTPSLSWSSLNTLTPLTCTFPISPKANTTPQILWSLNNNVIENGYIVTKSGKPLNVVKKTRQEVLNYTVTQTVDFVHLAGGSGDVKCIAFYDADIVTIMTPVMRTRNCIITGPDPIIMFPDLIANVTFTSSSQTNSTTLFSLDTLSSNTTVSNISNGVRTVEDFSIAYKARNRSSSYFYSVESRTCSGNLSGDVIVLGLTQIESSVYSVLNSRTVLEAWVGCREQDHITVAWYHGNRFIGAGFSSAIHNRGRNLSLVIEKTTDVDFNVKSAYYATISFNNSVSVTTQNFILEQIVLRVGESSYTAFAKESLTIFLSITGPEAKRVTLISKDSFAEITAEKTKDGYSVTISSLRHHNIGLYYFIAKFNNGIIARSDDIMLDVRVKCKPLKAPASVWEHQVDSDSNIVATRTCKDTLYGLGENTFLCDTKTGEWNSTIIEPCYHLQ